MRTAIDKLAISLLFAIPCLALSRAQVPARQAEPPVKSMKDQVMEARNKLRDAELTHPGNTVEVAQALDDLVNQELSVEAATPELLELARRFLSVAEASAGTHSKLYVDALVANADACLGLDRPAEGLPLVERALEIAQQHFAESSEFFAASFEKAMICEALGDFACALRTDESAIVAERKGGAERARNLINSLSNSFSVKDQIGDYQGAGRDMEEALSADRRFFPNDPELENLEQDAGAHYIYSQEFSKSLLHFNRALELALRDFGPETPQTGLIHLNLGNLYSRMGDFPRSWKEYEIVFGNTKDSFVSIAGEQALFARSLASGGDLQRAIGVGLQSAQSVRENFVLQARLLPERQALAYYKQSQNALEIVLSVFARHPDIPAAPVYQEVVRSRALVADEMARRQKNLNANNDPEVARMLKEMDQARAALLNAERSESPGQDNGEAVRQVTQRIEKIESDLALRSVTLRNDERVSAIRLEDLRSNIPAHSVLISYVAYKRYAVEKVDPSHTTTPSYMAFVLKSDSDAIRVFDLGDAKPIDDLVKRARVTADAEAHAGGYDAKRNERAWREAGEALRRLVWDPLRAEVGDAKLALVVPDGMLNLIPFSGLPDGKGYLVERGPVIHVLSSERDLAPTEQTHSKTGLVAFGNPAFGNSANEPLVAGLREAGIACDGQDRVEFLALPGTEAEVMDIRAAWQRWNGREASALETGANATRVRFLEEAPRGRVLHLSTHAFLLDKSCGNGNPLLRSGLVFARDASAPQSSILTAQQIASMDLNGLDWAVLSACNTGNGELQNGEGVLGLERAFRVAGARSVVMSLWPVDDTLSRGFMRELYYQRLALHASTADAVWNAERKLLRERRAAGKTTHPWYWAGFLASGDWK